MLFSSHRYRPNHGVGWKSNRSTKLGDWFIRWCIYSQACSTVQVFVWTQRESKSTLLQCLCILYYFIIIIYIFYYYYFYFLRVSTNELWSLSFDVTNINYDVTKQYFKIEDFFLQEIIFRNVNLPQSKLTNTHHSLFAKMGWHSLLQVRK